MSPEQIVTKVFKNHVWGYQTADPVGATPQELENIRKELIRLLKEN